MNKEYISKLGQYALKKIIEFSEYYENDNIMEISYANWNVRDVIGHINNWVKFSSDKLESIKTNKIFKDIEHKNLDEFNKMNYEKYKSKSLDDVIKESKIFFQNYENVLNLFNDDELLSKEFPTGFSCSLWEYMALDIFIHPINHILYQYIKNKDYNKFINEVEESKSYSNNNIEIYNFCNLFEQKEEKEKCLNELFDIIKNKDNKFLEEIIKTGINVSLKK
jgi:hypothetical protein